MEAHLDRPKAPKSGTGSKPVAKDDLQTLPLAEVEKTLGSSPNGLTQTEAQKRLTRYMQIEGFAERGDKTADLKPLQITPKAA